MISADSVAVLHVGAAKCGSSAIQTALSRNPELIGSDGRRYVYAYNDPGSLGLRGRLVGQRGAARRSVHGYVNWPNLGGDAAATAASGAAMAAVVREAKDGGLVPILSCEGWLHRSALLAEHVLPLLPGRAAVVVLARPPLDLMNAAYWQWGVWTGLGFDTWMSRQKTVQPLAASLQAWAALPQVTGVHLRLSEPDAVAALCDVLAAPSPPAVRRNRSAPAALIGFQLRNRAFRTSSHDSSVDFVFDRWCFDPRLRRPWAISAATAEALIARWSEDSRRAMALAEPGIAEAMARDPRWFGVEAYAERLSAPPPALDDPADLQRLHAALGQGLGRLLDRLGLAPEPLPPFPGAAAGLAAQDAVVAEVLTLLIEADALWRAGGRAAEGLAGAADPGPSG